MKTYTREAFRQWLQSKPSQFVIADKADRAVLDPIAEFMRFRLFSSIRAFHCDPNLHAMLEAVRVFNGKPLTCGEILYELTDMEVA